MHPGTWCHVISFSWTCSVFASSSCFHVGLCFWSFSPHFTVQSQIEQRIKLVRNTEIRSCKVFHKTFITIYVKSKNSLSRMPRLCEITFSGTISTIQWIHCRLEAFSIVTSVFLVLLHQCCCFHSNIDFESNSLHKRTMIFLRSFFPFGRAICSGWGKLCGLMRVRHAISHLNWWKRCINWLEHSSKSRDLKAYCSSYDNFFYIQWIHRYIQSKLYMSIQNEPR